MAKCEKCGNSLNAAANCPVCLLQLGMSDHGNEQSRHAGVTPDRVESLEEMNAQFPNFEILRLIGRGGMGAIYHARQRALDRDVALKVIASEVAGDSSFLERFEREAKTLARLSHPNIVTVYDYGHTSSGEAYLVMEYVDGINLREAIASNSVGAEDALEVVATICRALQFAHDKGVVHRDIKPENILLGEDGSLKVADFGIAKIIDESIRTPTLTATRQVLGSLHYLAPEHLEAPSEVDHRVDLYAVGVIFYELLTGQLPLGRYEPPSFIRNNLSPQLDKMVLRTLHRKPALRYQSASELITDLNNVDGVASSMEDIPVIEPVPHEPHGMSVPFSIDTMAGFAEVVGMIHCAGDHFAMEYKVRDAFGWLKSKTHRLEIPFSKLARVEHSQGIFRDKITLCADTISTLGKLPNAETGQVELKIKRAHRVAARAVISASGFSTKKSGIESFQAALASGASESASMDAEHADKWMIFSALIFLSGLFNAGGLAVLEYLFTTELDEIALVGATVGAAVLLGPIAAMQVAGGLLSLLFRPRGLAKAVSVVSVLPVAPAWVLSCPTAIWAFRWLSKSSTGYPSSSAIRENSSQNWGATTMMFIRESRWGKIIALANVAAAVLAAIGFGVVYLGRYPVAMEYRVVDTSVKGDELVDAVNARLGNSTASYMENSRLTLSVWAGQRDRIVRLLEIEDTVQLAWLSGNQTDDADSMIDVDGTLEAAQQTVSVVGGLTLPDSVSMAKQKLGDGVRLDGNPIDLADSYVTKLLTLPGNKKTLQMDLSEAGKKAIENSGSSANNSAGIGLIVEGMLHGFSATSSITGNRLTITLSDDDEFSSEAIVAAIRGPVIPSDLELLSR